MTGEYKVDPRVSHLVVENDGEDLPAYGHGDYEVFVQFSTEANDSDFKKVSNMEGVTDFTKIAGGYCSIKVSREKARKILGEIRRQEDVLDLELVRLVCPHLDKSVEQIHAKANGGAVSLEEGKGVVIGIVDYGLDYLLHDFRDPTDGTSTRVEYLWDQSLKAANRESAPTKYKYGVEYDRQKLQAAIDAANTPGSQVIDRAKAQALVRHNPRDAHFSDISGHGTHVAGIAAGNGKTCDGRFPVDRYVGVAPGSALVFVSLGREETLGAVNTAKGTLANSVHLAHAVAYCFEKADSLGMPCVVNLSMGFNGGGHDGKMAVEKIIDALVNEKPGRAVIVAAGNEGASNLHSSGKLKMNVPFCLNWMMGYAEQASEEQYVEYPGAATAELEIWYPKGNEVAVRLIAPKSRESQSVASATVRPGMQSVRQNGNVKFEEQERARITSFPASAWSGDARIHIRLDKGELSKGIRYGNWIVEMELTKSANGANDVPYHAWIERAPGGSKKNPLTCFARNRDANPNAVNKGWASPDITLTTPATAEGAIAVASCKKDSNLNLGGAGIPMADSSGRGPTRSGSFKPEITAPGEGVMSSFAAPAASEGIRGSSSGTSMAAPHVTGVVARLLSYNKTLTVNKIRDVLINSADSPDVPTNQPHWDPRWGYGLVNAGKAMEYVRRNYPVR